MELGKELINLLKQFMTTILDVMNFLSRQFISVQMKTKLL